MLREWGSKRSLDELARDFSRESIEREIELAERDLREVQSYISAAMRQLERIGKSRFLPAKQEVIPVSKPLCQSTITTLHQAGIGVGMDANLETIRDMANDGLIKCPNEYPKFEGDVRCMGNCGDHWVGVVKLLEGQNQSS